MNKLPIPQLSYKLGTSINPLTKKVTFAIWAPSAKSVNLQFFKDGYTKSIYQEHALTLDGKTGVWSIALPFEKEIFYEYKIESSKGIKNCLDPYAKSMAAYCNDGTSGRAALVDLSLAKPYKISLASSMEKVSPQEKDKSKTVIYEISVRDATITKNGGGTYLDFINKLKYIKDLGVTHIQLMPVQNFYNNDETKKDFEDSGTVHNNNYNWGYDPHNYFTPEGWYSKQSENPYERIRELRTLIKAAHIIGLNVILDVVYNHMAKTDFLDDIEPDYYFRKNPDGSYKNGSGCGNDLKTENFMTSKLIIDSCAYWVKNYDVDGFRFDLMGLIDSKTLLTAYKTCKKLKSNILFIGEGWKMYTGEEGTCGLDQNYMTKTDDIAVFNDEARDLVKAGGMNERGQGFLTGRQVNLKHLFYNLTGRPQINYEADSPLDSVLYFDCHDGLTLHDSIVVNGNIDESKPEDRKIALDLLKIGNAMLLSSQGIVFLHAGQEFGRTKPAFAGAFSNDGEIINQFVKNSYDSSDNINQIHWYATNEVELSYRLLLEYTKGLIALRKKFKAFTLGSQKEVEKFTNFIETNNPFVLCYTIENEGNLWYLCFNASEYSYPLMMKKSGKLEIFVNKDIASSEHFAEFEVIEGKEIQISPLSSFIAKINLQK